MSVECTKCGRKINKFSMPEEHPDLCLKCILDKVAEPMGVAKGVFSVGQ